MSLKKWGIILASLMLLTAGSGLALGQNGMVGTAASVSAYLPWTIARVAPTDVTSSDDLGAYASTAIQDGKVLIAYYDATNKDLKMARLVGSGGNCGPGNTWSCETVDSDGDVGKYASIATGGQLLGNPGIAYYDATNYALKFAAYWCTPHTCSWSISTLQSGNSLGMKRGWFASLKFASDGTPHIAYYATSLSGQSLRHAYYVGSGGNCGESDTWQCDTIDSGTDIGQYASLDLDDADQVRIAYYDGGNGYLKYAQQVSSGGNCGPSNTWSCDTLDSTADVGRSASLRVNRETGNQPAIAYYDKTNGQLKYARWVGSGGNCGYNSSTFEYEWQCDALDDMGVASSPVGTSLALDEQGYPFIAYQDASDDQSPATLNVARPTNALDKIQGNCGPKVGLLYTWQCDTMDGGGSWTDEADYASIAVASNGLATIAYHEIDSYYNGGRLKIAYQSFRIFMPVIIRTASLP